MNASNYDKIETSQSSKSHVVVLHFGNLEPNIIRLLLKYVKRCQRKYVKKDHNIFLIILYGFI